MGKILAGMYGIGALGATAYGYAQGWAQSVHNGLNTLTNGGLEKIVDAFPAGVQPAIETVPYFVAGYAAMKLGERALGNRHVTIAKSGGHP